MNIEYIDISKISPYKDNAKKHSKEQVDQVARSIKKFGWVQPLVIDANNIVIIGHCRLEAAEKLGQKEVPVLRAVNLTEKEVKALRLADNKLNESAWDMDLVIGDLKSIGLDFIGFTGFDKELVLDEDGFGTEFTLSSEDKSPFQQITFVLADEQAEQVKEAIAYAKTIPEYKNCETMGNENSNGNALHFIMTQWKKTNN